MKKALLTVLLVFPWSLLGFAFLGCQEALTPEKPVPAASKPLEKMTDQELREHADGLARQLAEARKQTELNRQAHIEKILRRAAAVFGLLALGCIAVVIWTPFKREGLIGALACTGLAPAMLFLVKLSPWFDLIGGLLVIGFLVVAGVVIKGLVRKDRMVTSLVTGAESFIQEAGEPANLLKVHLAEAQTRAGITEELRAVRRRLGL